MRSLQAIVADVAREDTHCRNSTRKQLIFHVKDLDEDKSNVIDWLALITTQSIRLGSSTNCASYPRAAAYSRRSRWAPCPSIGTWSSFTSMDLFPLRYGSHSCSFYPSICGQIIAKGELSFALTRIRYNPQRTSN